MGGVTANDIGSLGLNRLPGVGGEIGNAVTWLNPFGAVVKGIGAGMRTADGVGTPAQTMADSMGVMQQQQNQAANDAKQKLLEAPKNVTPDNFLAMKARQLAQLRIGMGGGMPGSATPSPVLSSASLSGADPSKKRMLGA